MFWEDVCDMSTISLRDKNTMRYRRIVPRPTYSFVLCICIVLTLCVFAFSKISHTYTHTESLSLFP